MKSPTKQYGIALLIFVIVVAFASISYTLGNISIEQLKADEAASTQAALQRAKQALLDYAVTYEDEAGHEGEYGFLPCPDYRPTGSIPEGGSDYNCGAAQENVLGLFPWASLETGILRSGTGECLWYGVSGEYKDSPKTSMLNHDTNGAIRLYQAGPVGPVLKQGALPQDRVVAVIIDPSKVRSGQNRVFDDTSLCGKDHVPARYLDGQDAVQNAVLTGGALAIDDFIAGTVGSDVNDRVVVITREELWDALHTRDDFIEADGSALNQLTEALARCIAEYGNQVPTRRLPRPAAVDFSGADYRERINYSDTTAVSYLGRYPYTVNDSDSAIGHASVPDPGQPRLFQKGFCSALLVDGLAVNLEDESEEGYKTWNNWKDHFFYAVSSYYAPSGGGYSAAPNCTGSNCIEVNGVEYAAVVLFAGRRQGLQLRNEPIAAGETDTKNSLASYIEVVNPAGDGTGDYTPTGNDIAFCITDSDPFTVVSCN